MQGPSPISASAQSGFSLPLVLLVIGALAGASVLATLAARGQARGAAAGTGLAQADALADAGVALALLELDRHRTPGRNGANTQPGRWSLTCRIDPGTLSVTTQDEGGKIDLNFADARLLTAIFVGIGLERSRAQAIADAIIDFRDPDDERQPSGAERAEYVEAGRSAGPKNARFTDAAEVRAVLGMTQDLADRISPYVTVHSARDGIDPAVADAALVALLVRGDAQAGFTSADGQDGPTRGASDTALPPQFVQPSLRRYYTITADARLARARFVREALVDSSAIAASTAGSRHAVSRYRFWSWRRRDSAGADEAPAGTPPLPPC